VGFADLASQNRGRVGSFPPNVKFALALRAANALCDLEEVSRRPRKFQAGRRLVMR